MGLYERIVPGASNRIPAHAFGSGLRELARGAITKAQLVSAFNLTSAEESQLDSIISVYNGLATDNDKLRFCYRFEDVVIMAEMGYYSESKVKSELGFA